MCRLPDRGTGAREARQVAAERCVGLAPGRRQKEVEVLFGRCVDEDWRGVDGQRRGRWLAQSEGCWHCLLRTGQGRDGRERGSQVRSLFGDTLSLGGRGETQGETSG